MNHFTFTYIRPAAVAVQQFTISAEFIWIGSRQQLDIANIPEQQLQYAIVQYAYSVSDLGIVGDSQLNMSAHMTAVSRSSLFQQHPLTTIRHSKSMDTAKTLRIHF